MSNAYDGLEPRVLWKNFKSLTDTPRPSEHEAMARDMMTEWAIGLGYKTVVDETGNLLIRVPAAPGKEGCQTLILQGHLDMVPEKNNDVDFDFLTQGIKVYRDGDWLKAEGTTLGADNGIGLAMAMAIAEDPSVANPPLEILCTVEEETGLVGATNLKPGFVTGTRLINIDSEEEGYLFAGCAGGCDTHTYVPLTFTDLPDDYEAVVLTVKGLAGGHSGLVIHENRGNALKFLANWLHRVALRHELSLCSFSGGDKHNAIPREAQAIVAGPVGLMAVIDEIKEPFKAELWQEFSRVDPKMELVTARAGATEGLVAEDSKRFLHLIMSMPHGVESMSKEIPGLVETSCNLARVDWEEEQAMLLSSSRSSVASALERNKDLIHAVTYLAGADAQHGEGYPGWQPNLDSKLLAFAKEQYLKVTGKEAIVTAIHAGLECGIIGETREGLDMISLGPDMHDVHSPDERLSISSTNRVYEYLKALIEALD
jgi:dipeptidase D